MESDRCDELYTVYITIDSLLEFIIFFYFCEFFKFYYSHVVAIVYELIIQFCER